jgi:hypothetical protein
MAKSSIGSGPPDRAVEEPSTSTAPPAQREGICDLYEPGHQIHYKHQGDAARTPAVHVREAWVDGTDVLLVVEDGSELHWRHHDPVRLERMLELVHGRCLAYPQCHALRVGPYWFNCATEREEFRDCRVFSGEPEGRTDLEAP